jgi:hypothetical protein
MDSRALHPWDFGGSPVRAATGCRRQWFGGARPGVAWFRPRGPAGTRGERKQWPSIPHPDRQRHRKGAGGIEWSRGTALKALDQR